MRTNAGACERLKVHILDGRARAASRHICLHNTLENRLRSEFVSVEVWRQKIAAHKRHGDSQIIAGQQALLPVLGDSRRVYTGGEFQRQALTCRRLLSQLEEAPRARGAAMREPARSGFAV